MTCPSSHSHKWQKQEPLTSAHSAFGQGAVPLVAGHRVAVGVLYMHPPVA